MALKYAIESLDGLDEATAALYTEQDGGGYALSVDGLPEPKHEDVGGLKRKLDELLAEKKAEQAKRKEIEEKARKDAEENARKVGDVTALEKSWKEKNEADVGEWKGRFESERSHVQRLLVDNVAAGLANDLALQGSANVLLPHIRNRLTVEYTDGNPTTRVLGPDGKPSAATIDELKAEFAANVAFAPIIAGSKASGSGAGGGNGGGAAPSGNRSKMTPADKAAFIAKHGAEAYGNLPN